MARVGEDGSPFLSESGRDELWSGLDRPWDLVIIGGGIVGAGLLHETARRGLRALLVEQRDFAWGSSSRTSQLIHGGLRYMKQARFRLSRALLRQRDRLLREAPGLVTPLRFLLPTYEEHPVDRWLFATGVLLYDVLTGRWRPTWRRYSAGELAELVPGVARDGLDGGYGYMDARTDDARLVLRVLCEGVAAGGVALNYVRAETLLCDKGQVVGAVLRDVERDRTVEVRARVVVNATGPWADRLRGKAGVRPRLRPARGSHLVFPRDRLPLQHAVSFRHPDDRRHLYAVPWESVTLVGATDLDHDGPPDEEPRATAEEAEYLVAALEGCLPGCGLRAADAIATFAGIRPTVAGGRPDPSDEPRDSGIWEDAGLITATTGKLTAFRIAVLGALRAARHRLPPTARRSPDAPLFPPPGDAAAALRELDAEPRLRLLGRYGSQATAVAVAAGPGELEPVPGTPVLWAELRWAVRAEVVVHLDDLLLRRTRLGILLAEGGAAVLGRVRAICQAELRWDDDRWQREVERYRRIWRDGYALPGAAVRASAPEPALGPASVRAG
ncbi:MAG: glycerol-3-phosphate dehydrogenase/oxidase [Gemmatimonadetes bacterium]|nr:glycerol-3-phosphate dehydrogenase/oxidase [Gemmatimonadota bacterium]